MDKEKVKEMSEKVKEKAKEMSEKAKEKIDEKNIGETIQDVKEKIKSDKRLTYLSIGAIVVVVFYIFYALFLQKSYISMVKESTLPNINNGTTIGNAFDNWQDCSDVDWTQTRTKNGMIYVIYTCDLKGVEPYTRKILKDIGEEKNKSLILKSQKIRVKFLISHDKKSFTVDGVDYICSWGDGKTTIYRANDDVMLNTLKSIYNNEHFWPEVKSGSYAEVVVSGILLTIRSMGEPYNGE